ncbi:hypothetical protein [Luteolibacter luteus]|uniref:Uncharacterized protein n=1 Tax=Luteolibacter luteus TaxID=2728835 RepID=A0A858RG54_9BACT|nr:hypothetical protein [Luteolibacter luteus]QJE95571.1 hypothetical protein HHL09_07150 [Luteolibacter luteus]
MKARLADPSVVFDSYPVTVACLKMDYSEFSSRYALTLPVTEHSGMGRGYGAMFILSSGKPVYYNFWEGFRKHYSEFECSDTEDQLEIASRIRSDFGLGDDDFFWTAEHAGFSSFVVTRQDDHGNEFEISAFESRFDAVALKDELETYQHKQSYAIEGRKEPIPAKRRIDYSAYKI